MNASHLMEIIEFSGFSLTILLLIFLVTAGVITWFGYYLSAYADQIADLTGIGEAAAGAILLGAVTSISGIVTTVAAAIEGYAALSVSNSVGGIVAQTTFLAVADITYRRANLEHAAASISNLMYGVLLIILMMELLFIAVVPPVTLFGFHPGLLLAPVTYVLGVRMIIGAENEPMWNPKNTEETVLDIPSDENMEKDLATVLWKFGGCALVVAACGYVVAQAGIALSDKTGLSSSFVGALFTSIATSLPELVVTVTAIQQGALTLAVGNILGGNTFDVLMIFLADFFYRPGSILHDSGSGSLIVIVLAGFVTSIMLLGLLDREKRGPVNIGWESMVVLLSFIAGYAVLYFA